MGKTNKKQKEYVNLDNSIKLDYGFDGDYEQVDKRDHELVQDKKSDDAYQKTADKIVNISREQLDAQREDKGEAKKKLLNFFIGLLIAQLCSIVIVMIFKGFFSCFDISDTVLITFITSVFVETLGVIAIMVKSSFNNSQEIQIIKILSSYIKDFKVYNSSEHNNYNRKD